MARVKKPIKNNRYSNTHNNRHRDNVAVESFKRSDRIKRPMQRKEDKQLPGTVVASPLQINRRPLIFLAVKIRPNNCYLLGHHISYATDFKLS